MPALSGLLQGPHADRAEALLTKASQDVYLNPNGCWPRSRLGVSWAQMRPPTHTHTHTHTPYSLPRSLLPESPHSQPSSPEAPGISLHSTTGYLPKSCQRRRASPGSIIHIMSFLNYQGVLQVLRFLQHFPLEEKERIRKEGELPHTCQNGCHQKDNK